MCHLIRMIMIVGYEHDASRRRYRLCILCIIIRKRFASLSLASGIVPSARVVPSAIGFRFCVCRWFRDDSQVLRLDGRHAALVRWWILRTNTHTLVKLTAADGCGCVLFALIDFRCIFSPPAICGARNAFFENSQVHNFLVAISLLPRRRMCIRVCLLDDGVWKYASRPTAYNYRI